jgi:hypothetical protein
MIVRDLSQHLLRCLMDRGVLRRVHDGDYRVNVDNLERGDTFLPGQRPQSTSTPQTTSTTVGGSVFYTAATGTTESFVDVNLDGDDEDDGDDAASQGGAGAGGTGGGASSDGAGDNAGGDGNAGGGVQAGVGGTGAGASDVASNYGELTTVVTDSGFGDAFGRGEPSYAGGSQRRR